MQRPYSGFPQPLHQYSPLPPHREHLVFADGFADVVQELLAFGGLVEVDPLRIITDEVQRLFIYRCVKFKIFAAPLLTHFDVSLVVLLPVHGHGRHIHDIGYDLVDYLLREFIVGDQEA